MRGSASTWNTDAIVRVLRSCICGSDLWPYGGKPAQNHGDRIGHEFLGVVEDSGAGVSGVKPGDGVVAPFVWADNTCDFCREGLQTSCRRGGNWGSADVDGAGGSALLPSLLTLSDVFPTGHHCAVTAGVNPRTTVTVIGDGAVGLSAVLAAKRLGAERIVLMGRHTDRTDLGRDFGATDVVPERGDDGVDRVRELTGGDGTHAVLECVGHKTAIETARQATTTTRPRCKCSTDDPPNPAALNTASQAATAGPRRAPFSLLNLSAPGRAHSRWEQLRPGVS